jgi:UDP-N-acetylmuramate: L-alanyl-gamma-D-glutamyl-meso-diaminopimelate ligase
MNDTFKHVHMLGICGTGMTSLASLFKETGRRVTGSDQNVYPPMSTRLDELGIEVFEGYSPDHLSVEPDLVIVGNVITKDNPEVQEVMKRGLPYRSMPEALAEFFLEGRTPVVIAGTHGKTTLSTLTAWLLESAGEEPGFFIGGIGRNFKSGSHLGKGPFFVIEGDEYDSAFFDKGSKFLHYRPQAVLLTSVEFDHADIYRNFGHVMRSFEKLVALIPPDGLLLACGEDENVRSLAAKAACKTLFYGHENADYVPERITTAEGGTSFTLKGPSGSADLVSPLYGLHNLMNVSAAAALLMESGIPPEKIQRGLSSFLGIARRQEVVGEEKSITVVDDFAHHPTAVRKTIDAMRMRYPGRRLWALFEPRSNTSRRKVFQNDFVTAFKHADRVIIAGIHQPERIPPDERLDTAKLADDIMKAGTDAHFVPDVDNIAEFVLRGLNPNDVVLIMSNGSFGGLANKLVEGIKKLKTD